MNIARFRTRRWSRIGMPAVALVAAAVGGVAALTGCAGGSGQHAAASQAAGGRTASRVSGASRPVAAGSGSAAPGSVPSDRPSGQSSPPAAGTSRTSGAATPVVAIGRFAGRAPTEIDFSADGGNVATGLRWQSWTVAGAVGQGTSGIESCVPNCADGSVRYVPTTITLSSPVNGRFTVITEKRNGHAVTVKWPVRWPLGAS